MLSAEENSSFLLLSANNTVVIFDFDSTIIPEESLDEIILRSSSTQDSELKKKLSEITDLGMSGSIDFEQSLKMRFENACISNDDIRSYLAHLKIVVDKKMIHLFNLLLSAHVKVLVVSGGFREWVVPFCKEVLGIKASSVYANELVFDGLHAKTFNPTNAIIQHGKPALIESILKSQKYDRAIMVGDGFTDYMVYQKGVADHFVGVGIYAKRQKVKRRSQYYVEDVDALVHILRKFCQIEHIN